MECKQCTGRLEVLRRCRQVRLKCNKCGREYQVHEVADRLDRSTEEQLSMYTAIIYD